MSDKLVTKHWDKRYEEGPYIWGHDRSEVGNTLHNLVLFGAVENKTLEVLDVGCDPGRDVLYCVIQGNNATGIDLSGVALDTAKLDYNKMRDQRLVGRATFIQGTINDLDQSGPQYDVILSNLVAHVWSKKKLQGFAKAASKLLKDNGLLIVSGFSADAFDPDNEIWAPGQEGYAARWKKSGRPSAYFFERPVIEEVFTRDFRIDRIRHTISAPDKPGIASPVCIMTATRRERHATP